jgi:hypothetical protein
MAKKKKVTKRNVRKTSVKRLKTKAASKSKTGNKKKVVRKANAKPKPPQRKVRSQANEAELVSYGRRGLGARTGGQAGDTQGLASGPDVDSESVEELLEEGQSFEAEVVEGVENAADPDQGEVRTRQVPENDVPEEYQEDEDFGGKR